MEMIRANGFYEMSADEMCDIEAGGFWLCVGGVVCGWVVTKGLDHIYDAVGRWTGWW